MPQNRFRRRLLKLHNRLVDRVVHANMVGWNQADRMETRVSLLARRKICRAESWDNYAIDSEGVCHGGRCRLAGSDGGSGAGRNGVVAPAEHWIGCTGQWFGGGGRWNRPDLLPVVHFFGEQSLDLRLGGVTPISAGRRVTLMGWSGAHVRSIAEFPCAKYWFEYL
ncbi:hypothetical protein ACFVMC_15185 [Nocardia sp. NPDC127579]|uniref:hypothetical protein n=1 Tax=Nocardia sp. NPDC127579 TaxID=3345402 RepID=UPI00363F29C4